MSAWSPYNARSFLRRAKDRVHDEWVLKVSWPADPVLVASYTEGPEVIDFLDGLRRAAIAEHQALVSEQKACGKAGAIDAARWYRGLVSDALKRVRAIRLWLGHFDPHASGDAPWIEFWDWPTDLAPEIHDVARSISLWSTADRLAIAA